MKILVLEPDTRFAALMKAVLAEVATSVVCVSNADEAIIIADKLSPDLIITELSLAGHSGTEFLYEFRTYGDWVGVPVLIYSSMRLSDDITSSKDWRNLNITEILYKPDVSLRQLAAYIESAG